MSSRRARLILISYHVLNLRPRGSNCATCGSSKTNSDLDTYRPHCLHSLCVIGWKSTIVMERRRDRRCLDVKKAIALARFLKDIELDSDTDDPQPSTSASWSETRLRQYVHHSKDLSGAVQRKSSAGS